MSEPCPHRHGDLACSRRGTHVYHYRDEGDSHQVWLDTDDHASRNDDN